MAETLTTVTADLRIELKDTDASNYRWTDAELARHIERAVDQFSRANPREMKSTKATTASSREIDISSGYDDLIRIHAVEYPVDKFPRQFQRFSYYNQLITLAGDVVPDGSNSYIYWGKVHTLSGSTNTIQEHHLPVVITGAAGFAALAWAAYAVNRVNVGGEGTPKDWLRWGQGRIRDFRHSLRGLNSKVRASSLYIPSRTASARTTDFGP